VKQFFTAGRLLFACLTALLIVNFCIFFVYADNDTPLAQTTVVIDVGHGGWDPGKVSADGILEKDVNLQIAEKLQAALEAKGCRVVLTRTEDTALGSSDGESSKTADMRERIAIMDQVAPDYMISIHQNSYSDPDVRGAQVFYYSTSSVSQSLAETIQSHLIQEVDSENRRQPKPGNDYYILKNSSCPAVIVECGFLSCPEEAAKLTDGSYQEKLAAAICNAVVDMSATR
jgi:N-acetylmuramoyl-L-alanine amidase